MALLAYSRMSMTLRPSIVLVSSQANFDRFYGVAASPLYLNGFTTDAYHLAYSAVSLDGDMKERREFINQRGLNSSYFEHKMVENLLHIESVSAVKALQIASDQGLPIYTVNSQNIESIMPTLSVSEEVRSNILDAVNAGKEVVVSGGEIAYYGFNGVGYIVRDKESGEGAYLISESLGGQRTVRKCTASSAPGSPVRVATIGSLKGLLASSAGTSPADPKCYNTTINDYSGRSIALISGKMDMNGDKSIQKTRDKFLAYKPERHDADNVYIAMACVNAAAKYIIQYAEQASNSEILQIATLDSLYIFYYIGHGNVGVLNDWGWVPYLRLTADKIKERRIEANKLKNVKLVYINACVTADSFEEAFGLVDSGGALVSWYGDGPASRVAYIMAEAFWETLLRNGKSAIDAHDAARKTLIGLPSTMTGNWMMLNNAFILKSNYVWGEE